MFNPDNKTDFSKFWNRLSTFYNFVPKEEKEIIENYWRHLFNGMEGLPYDLAQVTLAGYLDYTPGYIEDQYQEYLIIFNGNDKNVEIERFSAPVIISGGNSFPSSDNVIYNYKITALDANGETLPSDSVIIISGHNNLSTNNNYISWNSISGINSYNIYGRRQNEYFYITNTTNNYFYDNGSIAVNTEKSLPTQNTTISNYLYKIPNDFCYLTMPVLSGVTTNLVLNEQTDYIIHNLHFLKFFGKPQLNQPNFKETFVAPQALFLLPSLINLYFKAFGDSNNPEELVRNNYYVPYISGWLTNNYFERRKQYAMHLKYLSQGLTNALAKGPTFKNLKNAFCLISGMPFCYESGIVSNVWEDSTYNYVSISGGNTYQFSKPLTSAVRAGDVVERFHILASGINLHDYISSSGIIAEITQDNPEEYWYTLGIQRSCRTYNLNHYPPFVDYFTNQLLPAGLLVNYFNLPPRGTIWSANNFYNGGSLATFSGIVNDPENDILSFEWEHVLPHTDYMGSTNLKCTMNNPYNIQTTTTLTTPPVDRYYLFKLNVKDCDNSVDIYKEQNVRGTYSFSSWGQTVFKLGDAELRYGYLS